KAASGWGAYDVRASWTSPATEKPRREGSREFRAAAPRFRHGRRSRLSGAGRGRSGQLERRGARPAAVRAEAEPAAGATGGRKNYCCHFIKIETKVHEVH
ncbi:Hypothetical predicted protein, partial [Marmota monax]